jgi:hypothetical protein
MSHGTGFINGKDNKWLIFVASLFLTTEGKKKRR